MPNRQARRKEEREKVRQHQQSIRQAAGEHNPRDGMDPEPGPLGTYISKYRYGGKTWTLIQFTQPNSTTSVVFAPEDARRFAEDVLKLVDGTAITDGDEVAEASKTETGLLIANRMPDAPTSPR